MSPNLQSSTPQMGGASSRALSAMLDSNTRSAGARTKMRPEKYDGTADWVDYLRQFEIIAGWNGWSEIEKAAQLTMNLTGIARQAWTDCSADPMGMLDYQELVRTLTQRFAPGGQQDAYRAEFRNRIKHKDETYMALGHALRRLAARAFPKLNYEAREELVKDQFMQGLSDVEMRKYVNLCHPATVDEAITQANEYSTLIHSTKTTHVDKPKMVAAVQESSGNTSATQSDLTQTLCDLFK